jgi:hypothetical protein
MPTSHAISIAALLDALRDWLPDNLDEFAARFLSTTPSGGPMQAATRA